jgi:hypothetical protein
VVTTDATPTGTVPLTLRATSGTLVHSATVSLTIDPLIQTSQTGTVLYLQSHANGHIARIGLDTAWGGSIVEVSLDGTNFVNAHDTGREVQPSLYDGGASYDACAGCTGAWGWNPVLGGDRYGHGSPVLGQNLALTSLYTRATPLQWYPDHFGGGPSTGIPSDATFEQTVNVVSGAPLAFKVHFKLTHDGTDYHYNAGQEFPAVYVNSIYTTLAYYSGMSPWTGGALTKTPAPPSSAAIDNYASEQWAALVDNNNQGLAVFVPGAYPSWTSASFPGGGGNGPMGDATVYMRPFTQFTVAPGAVMEGDVFLIPGDADSARAVIYDLRKSVPSVDSSTPVATVDVPAANATLTGSSTAIAGWAFDNVAVSAVNVYVDGALRGAATLGIARQDVAAAYPHLAPVDCGWTYALDSTTLTNGAHTIVVHVTDSSNNDAVLAPILVTVSN